MTDAAAPPPDDAPAPPGAPPPGGARQPAAAPAPDAAVPAPPAPPCIYVDADACPVKNEVYRVAERYGLAVKVVANSGMRVPSAAWLELVIVPGAFDGADDWIVERATPRDIVITADIPLAARSLEKGARVLDHKGGAFTEAMIGDALASRELLAQLRAGGEITGGPAAFTPRDRSLFLQRLDETVQALKRVR